MWFSFYSGENRFTKVKEIYNPMSNQKWNVRIDVCMEPVGLQDTVFYKSLKISAIISVWEFKLSKLLRESVVVKSVQGTIWEDRNTYTHLKRLLSSNYLFNEYLVN